MQPSEAIIQRLADEINIAGSIGFIPNSDATKIAEALRGKERSIRVVLYEPTQVVARYATSLADLRYVRCTKCGKVYNLGELGADRLKFLKCSNNQCGGQLIPAPVWCISGRSFPSASNRRLTTRPGSGAKLVLSIEDYTKARTLRGGVRGSKAGRPDRVIASDMSRPLSSLKFIYSNNVPHDPRFQIKRENFDYIISSMPMESITKPVTVTAFAYRSGQCTELETTTGKLDGISEILLCKDLEVLQTTVVYKVGHPRSSRHERISVIDMEKNENYNVYQVNLPARYITTVGIVIKIDEARVESSLKKLGYKQGYESEWTALHTISHAFLVNLPRITGLEGNDFGEAIDTSNKEIAVFDNSVGGLGGVEGVVFSGALAPNYEWAVRDSHKCPLACMRACKACLYTDSCFMLNWRLDRRIIKELGW
ncbi:MAG: hypothetical protein QW189_07755 [Thermofilaceae archaeon]